VPCASLASVTAHLAVVVLLTIPAMLVVGIAAAGGMRLGPRGSVRTSTRADGTAGLPRVLDQRSARSCSRHCAKRSRMAAMRAGSTP
jgi:hypothetical protein